MSILSIRVGGVPEHFNFPWHLAIEKQLFAAQGLMLQWQDYGGGTGAMLQALQQKELDVAILLTEGVAAALAQRQVAITPISTFVATPLVWGIHVAAQSGITHLPHLQEPITVAISRYGSGSHLMACFLATQQKWSKIRFEVVQNLAGAIQALPARQADIFLWEKFTTQPYVAQGIFKRIGELPTPWACFVIVARTAFWAEYKQELTTLIKIVTQEAAWLKQQPDAAERIAQRYQLPVSQVVQWLAQTEWCYEFTDPQVPLQQATQTLQQLRLID